MPGLILVIDDDAKITALLKRSLTYEGFRVATAKNGEEGLSLLSNLHPDLIILDIMLPGLDGWEICRQIRNQSNTPILMLSARDEIYERVRGLDLGADDYLTKPFALEELLARVRALLRRQNSDMEAQIYRFADLVLDTKTREAKRGERTFSLTPKEYDLLLTFLQHPRQVLTKEQLMDKVWGYDFAGESNVLEVYIGMLRQKTEENNEPRLLHTVRGMGYILKEQ
jgi:two-component system response regulator MprA